jgi:capsular polysaccharide export protein
MDGGGYPKRRNFLILQGCASRFFARLGQTLEARGYQVKRVNFHAGDWLFGPLFGACNYRGSLERWPEFLRAKLREWNITDIILFADCRPIHTAAIKIASEQRIPYYVFEEGYLRPDWITLEEGGINGNSSIPRDPACVLATAKTLPPWHDGKPVFTEFWRLASQDVAYNLSTVFLGWLFPRYRRHRPWSPIVEYAGWVGRIARQMTVDRGRRAAALERLQGAGQSYYFFPLQLEGDTQISWHSDFKCVSQAIERVVSSFAANAPADTLLVIKEHPLDNGLEDWRYVARKIAERAGVADRVIYLAGGNLELLVAASRAVVTVNSTVGTRALVHGKPLIALGRAIYDMPGLTFQDGLDAFWTGHQPTDAVLFNAFTRVLQARCLVNGGFHTAPGIALAIAGSVERLEAHPVLFVEPEAAPASGGEFVEPDAALASGGEFADPLAATT